MREARIKLIGGLNLLHLLSRQQQRESSHVAFGVFHLAAAHNRKGMGHLLSDISESTVRDQTTFGVCQLLKHLGHFLVKLRERNEIAAWIVLFAHLEAVFGLEASWS